MAVNRVAKLVYCLDWAKQQPISMPGTDNDGAKSLVLKDEEHGVVDALMHHASLLYSNPLVLRHDMRSSYRRIRQSLKEYTGLISRKGFVGAIVALGEMAHAFLCGFYFHEGHLFYKMDEMLAHSPLYWTIKTLCNREINMELDCEMIRFILSFHVFLTKIKMSRPDLENSSLSDWIQRQVDPTPMVASRTDIEAIRSIISWLIQLEDPIFQGSHGPGSTSSDYIDDEGRLRVAKTIPEKNMVFKPDLRVHLIGGVSVDGTTSLEFKDPGWDEVVFVAKDVKSLRPITKTDATLQYCQQGVKSFWYVVNDNDSEQPIRHFVKYADQRPSQMAAIAGSTHKGNGNRTKPSTIDMQHSSDSVSTQMVTELFSGDLLHYIMLARSWYALTERGLVEHNMYGGMGSALTFPVQTTIYTAMSIWASILADAAEDHLVYDDHYELLSYYLNSDGFRPEFHRIQKNIRIYGDDIALPDNATEILYKLLSDFGLTVNKRKSFTGDSPVRESCGVYALNGYDITPLRYRLPCQKNGAGVDADTYEAMRSLANRAYVRGYKVLYKSVVTDLKRKKILITSDALKPGIKTARIRTGKGKFYTARQNVNAPELLFEQWNGDRDYIGFISSRPSMPTISINVASQTFGFTTYRPRAESARDATSENYHLQRFFKERELDAYAFALRGREKEEELRGVTLPVDARSTEEERDSFFRRMSAPLISHGKVPLKNRLDRHNAYPIYGLGNLEVWGWAPIL